MIKSELLGALARGYCSEKNSSKTVDPDLIEAMADELLLLYCKTQGKLFDDPRCPHEQISHGIGLDHEVTEVKINCRQNPDMGETYPVKPMKNDDHCLNIKDFQKDLEKLINRHSKENGSNTPDWVLASYLVRCLEAFDACIELRERYYGREKLHGFVTRIENQP